MAAALRAMLFDLDGTLVDSHALMARCYTDVLAPHLKTPLADQSTLASLFLRQLGRPLDVIFVTTLRTLGHSPESAARVAPLLCTEYRRHMSEIDRKSVV